MTASTTTTARAADDFPVFQGVGSGFLQVAYGSHTFVATDDEDGDIYELCKLPKGAVVLGGYVIGTDLDTGTEALDIDIGWAANGDEIADPDGFGNLGLWSGDVVTDVRPEVGIYYPLGGVLFGAGFKTFEAETTIQFEVNTAAGTLGGGFAGAVIFYVVP